MKESYFTSENIENKAEEWLQKLRRYREKHDIDFQPENSALLVLDMQRYFLDKGAHAYIPSVPVIVPKVKSLMDIFLKNDLPVILTRHLDVQCDSNPMTRWWRGTIREDDPLSEIVPELNHPNAIIVKKSQYDAFYRTKLGDILKEENATQVIITGVMTHLCCETTARMAFVRGFDVFFAIDGTATYDSNFHWAALLNLSHGFAIPVLCKEIQQRLKEYEDGHR